MASIKWEMGVPNGVIPRIMNAKVGWGEIQSPKRKRNNHHPDAMPKAAPILNPLSFPYLESSFPCSTERKCKGTTTIKPTTERRNQKLIKNPCAHSDINLRAGGKESYLS